MWTITSQNTPSGTYTLASGDAIWYTAGIDNSSTNYVLVDSYNDGTHVYQSDGATHQATVHNTKYIDQTHVNIDGAGSTLISSLSTSNCGLKFVFDTTDLNNASVQTTQTKFYGFDGENDDNPMGGANIQANGFSGSTQTGNTWVEANGRQNALTFVDQAAATSHTFYLATSLTPTSTGAKSGSFKLSLQYV